jgi:hypothetical protein
MDNDSPPAEPAATAAARNRPLYRPSRRQAAALAVIAVIALGCGFYVRYRLIEQSSVGIACQSGSTDLACSIRSTAITLFTPSAFGFTALVAALLNLYRPSLVLIALTLLAGGIGIVLYNVALSALALALVILSLARRAPERD